MTASPHAMQFGPKEDLARRTLSLQWAGRAPVHDLFLNDAAIAYYAGEELTLDNAEEVVYRALSQAVDCTRLEIILPHSPGTERDEDGSVWEYERWTTWLKEGPVRTYEDYRQSVRASAESLLSDWSARDQARLDGLLATHTEAKTRLGDVLLMGNFFTKAGFMALYAPNYLEFMGYLLADDPELVRLALEAHTHKSVQLVVCHDDLTW